MPVPACPHLAYLTPTFFLCLPACLPAVATITGKLRGKEKAIARVTAMRAASVAKSNPASPVRAGEAAAWPQPPQQERKSE